jgi:2-polyprenyl-3-methyl-5-hydroxy-6-metoxy-1,4-benzoquinol methylase
MAMEAAPGAGAEVESIDAVREKNFTRIIKTLAARFEKCKTILDVGCSHGVFLKLAKQYTFLVTGLEPDTNMAKECHNAGFEVIPGFFPHADELAGKTFDAIVFNDSFEHIPDSKTVMDGIKKHLNQNGVVIVNLPSSDGLMFHIAFLLYRMGLRAPFERLWQKGFASPHLHYFNAHNLKMLFEKYGFTQQLSMPLSYYVITGLWRRIRCKSSFFVSIITWFALVILYPLFIIKSDCSVSYFTIATGDKI